MAVLLLAEVLSGDVSIDQTAKALTAAKKLGDVTVLCASNMVTFWSRPKFFVRNLHV